MQPFILDNPTKLHFGKGCVDQLGNVVSALGKTVMLVYGKGSIKTSGLHGKVLAQLNAAGCRVVEFSGIKSNPVVSDVTRAAEVARQELVDVILAVGGGSVLDSAKIISIAAFHEGDAWDFYSRKTSAEKALPLVAVLTLAATGSEMNQYAVLQNDKSKQKLGFGSPLIYPKHSFLDPENTYSVPADYTAYGITDLIAHSLEQYFGAGSAPLADRFVESIIAEAITYGNRLMRDLRNYENREMIMWLATNALNGTTGHGRASGDWGVHGIEHSLSVLFDIAHGAGLSIVYPAWLRYHKEKVNDRLTQLAERVFRKSTADEFIDELEAFFNAIGSPTRLEQAGISRDKKEAILEHLKSNRVSGMHHALSTDAYEEILELMY